MRREKIQDIMIADKKREKKENRRTKETKKGSQNMIKACIFDLDGTIADTVESIAHAVNRVLEHFGLCLLYTSRSIRRISRSIIVA